MSNQAPAEEIPTSGDDRPPSPYPDVTLSILDQSGNEIATAYIVEHKEPKLDFTLHLREAEPGATYAAWAVMTHHLTGLEYERTVDLGRLAQCHLFTGADRAVACLWGTNRADAEETVAFAFAAWPESARTFDVMGARLDVARHDGGARLDLCEQPVWIAVDREHGDSLTAVLASARASQPERAE